MDLSAFLGGIVFLTMPYFFYIKRNNLNKSSIFYKKLGDKSSKRLTKILWLIVAIMGIMLIILSLFPINVIEF